MASVMELKVGDWPGAVHQVVEELPDDEDDQQQDPRQVGAAGRSGRGGSEEAAAAAARTLRVRRGQLTHTSTAMATMASPVKMSAGSVNGVVEGRDE